MKSVKELLKSGDEDKKNGNTESTDGKDKDDEDDGQKAAESVSSDDDDAVDAEAETHWDQYAMQQCADFASFIDLPIVKDDGNFVKELKASAAIQN